MSFHTFMLVGFINIGSHFDIFFRNKQLPIEKLDVLDLYW